MIERRDYSVIALLVVLLILMFFIGRLSRKQVDPLPMPDVSQYKKTIDSLVDISHKRNDTIFILRKGIDSLSKVKRKGHKKIKSDIDEIQKFTPTSRDKWRDSLRRAEGL